MNPVLYNRFYIFFFVLGYVSVTIFICNHVSKPAVLFISYFILNVFIMDLNLLEA